MTSRWSRLAPLTGVVAIAFFVVAGIVGGDVPDFDETAPRVLSFYAENESSQIASSILLAYGALFLLFFAGALRAVLRRAEGPAGGLSAVVLAGGVMTALGLAIFAGLTFTLADAADALEPAAAQGLNALNGNLFFPAAIGSAALMLAAGIAIARGGSGIPRWLGWVAILLGVVALSPVGFFAFLVAGLWILVVSVLLTARPPAAEARPA